MKPRHLMTASLIALTLSASPLTQAADPSSIQQRAQTAQQNWNSLSKAEQTQKKANAMSQAADKRTAWQAMSPEDKQAKRDARRAQMKGKFGSRHSGSSE